MIVAVSMWRDEADVARGVVEHLLAQGVDRIVVADNLSTDGTREILEQLPVTVVDDLEPAYYQGVKMSALMHAHCSAGDWVIPFDADELWTGNDGTLAQTLDAAGADILVAPVFDYLPQVCDDPAEPDPFRRIQWREQQPETLPVVAFRYHGDAVIHVGNHGVTHPGVRAEGLRVGHFQYRSWEQFRRKLRNGKAALEATNLPASTGAHWRTWGALDDDALRLEWERLLATEGLVHDPCR